MTPPDPIQDPHGKALPSPGGLPRPLNGDAARRSAAPSQRLGVLLAVAVMALLLWWGRPILLPLAIAVLLSFLVSPLCEWLDRRHIPRLASVILVVTLVFVALGGLGWAVFNGLQQLSGSAERLSSNLEHKLTRLPFRKQIEDVSQKLERAEKAAQAVTGDDVEDAASQPSTQPASVPVAAARLGSSATAATLPATQPLAARGQSTDLPLYVTAVPRQPSAVEQLGNFLGFIAGPLGTAGLVIVFTFFVLLQRDDLRDRIIALTAGHQLNLATQALDDAASRISRYLAAQAWVNGTYGLAIGLGLELIALVFKGEHFPSIWLWALLCGTLRFIPYLGPWIAAAFPLVYSIGWWPGYDMFLATSAYIVVVELLSNNLMEPMLYGSSTGMSPVAVISAAVFWTFVWGPVGLLVATPLTTCLVVLGRYVPALRFFDILLGDEPVLAPHSRLYQRLLALDAQDAQSIADEHRRNASLTATFDEVVLPALALAERDRHAGHLTEDRADFIRTSAREMVAQLAAQDEPLAGDSVDIRQLPSSGTRPARAIARIVIIPSVDAADMTAAFMLKALLDRRQYDSVVVGEQELTGEKLRSVFEQNADIAVISALPPSAIERAHLLTKRLRQAETERLGAADPMEVIIGLWTLEHPGAAEERLGQHESPARVVTRLAQAVEEVRQRAEVVAARRGSAEDPGKPAGVGAANISARAR